MVNVRLDGIICFIDDNNGLDDYDDDEFGITDFF